MNKKLVLIVLFLILFVFIILNNIKKSDSDEVLINQFDAEISMLTKEEGGRHTPFFTRYETNLKFKNSVIKGVIILPEDVEMVMPGDQVTVKIELNEEISLKQNEKFEIYDNDRLIGKGVIVKIER